MKILLIENKLEERTALKTVLKGQFLLETTSSLDEGIYLAENNEYSLIILCSTNLQDSTRKICTVLQNKKVQSLVLAISHKKNIQEKIAVFDAGADDYLAHPLEIVEIVTHVKALTRRVFTKQMENILQIDDLILNTVQKTVLRNGVTIQLRRKEYDLLEYLMRNPGRIISREMILNHVWTNAYEAYTNTIDVHVKYLRDQVDKPFSKKLIKTIHGFGYKISA